jgi:hypothetical protein
MRGQSLAQALGLEGSARAVESVDVDEHAFRPVAGGVIRPGPLAFARGGRSPRALGGRVVSRRRARQYRKRCPETLAAVDKLAGALGHRHPRARSSRSARPRRAAARHPPLPRAWPSALASGGSSGVDAPSRSAATTKAARHRRWPGRCGGSRTCVWRLRPTRRSSDRFGHLATPQRCPSVTAAMRSISRMVMAILR